MSFGFWDIIKAFILLLEIFFQFEWQKNEIRTMEKIYITKLNDDNILE